MNEIGTIAGTFAYLSILTLGGGMAAYPELVTLTVDVHRWLTMTQLVHLYSIGQAAPGPNMMMVVSIGERVSGPLGALTALVAYLVPSGLLVFGVGRLWVRLAKWRWRASIQRGLAPVSVGLVLAGALSLAKGAWAVGWVAVPISLVTFGILLISKINPALLVLAGAVLGVFAFGGI